MEMTKAYPGFVGDYLDHFFDTVSFEMVLDCRTTKRLTGVTSPEVIQWLSGD